MFGRCPKACEFMSLIIIESATQHVLCPCLLPYYCQRKSVTHFTSAWGVTRFVDRFRLYCAGVQFGYSRRIDRVIEACRRQILDFISFFPPIFSGIFSSRQQQNGSKHSSCQMPTLKAAVAVWSVPNAESYLHEGQHNNVIDDFSDFFFVGRNTAQQTRTRHGFAPPKHRRKERNTQTHTHTGHQQFGWHCTKTFGVHAARHFLYRTQQKPEKLVVSWVPVVKPRVARNWKLPPWKSQ